MAMAGLRVDVFFGPAYGLPLISNIPSVLMLHDLAFHRFPEMFTRKQRGYYQLFLRPSLRRARRVITPSRGAASDVRALLRVPDKKLDVVYNAVDPRFGVIDDALALSRVRDKYGLPQRFILFVGTLEPRKNLQRLVEAYAYARRKLGVEVPLILCGAPGWSYAEILEAPRRFGVAPHVKRLGFVDDRDLPALYSAATLFVYPSLYEGFGYPILEAMACRTPVVTSTSPALPEIGGDASIMVDPFDIEGLGRAIRDGLSNDCLRERLMCAGLERVKVFSTHNQVTRTLASLERARGTV
jgi:glycosyltransferase involved in cell wall biosynthesis